MLQEELLLPKNGRAFCIIYFFENDRKKEGLHLGEKAKPRQPETVVKWGTGGREGGAGGTTEQQGKKLEG